MKKKMITLVLAFAFVFSLSINIFAEGQIPTMGRNCPPEETCLVDSQESPTKEETANSTENPTIFISVIDYLFEIFG